MLGKRLIGKCRSLLHFPAAFPVRGCCRMNRWRARWSTRPLCCSGVLVDTNRMLALVTASQMASASVASFFCPPRSLISRTWTKALASASRPARIGVWRNQVSSSVTSGLLGSLRTRCRRSGERPLICRRAPPPELPGGHRVRFDPRRNNPLPAWRDRRGRRADVDHLKLRHRAILRIL